ncbi:MAG: Pyruvoyl-dependent arginine decarboxylase [Acidimicrobiales bacterium]|nr:MAG: pyruvoyl-dependent arginine decarboxylase [Actinomycetota bacterium]MBV6509688.1 Pyruvoyl-dependent arginine decarboxylase [Acidimicrobiales bacterium]RIK06377.1 MAG: pyruvoyl-dependent arginine decarboxylase [Acidobacteriota bacterium]
MKITVSCGSGVAPTVVAAYDAALCAAGIGDQNLVCLSSVIPPGSHVELATPKFGDDEIGNRLYCVLARADATELEPDAWAALAWVQDNLGRGLFAETSATDEEAARLTAIESLHAMTQHRPDWRWSEPQVQTNGVTFAGTHACSVVVASYETIPWQQPPTR